MLQLVNKNTGGVMLDNKVSFAAIFDRRTISALEGAKPDAWPDILVKAIDNSRDLWHFRAKSLRVTAVFRIFFPYRKWLILDVTCDANGKQHKVEVLNVEVHTDHQNLPIIKSRVFPENIGGGADLVGRRYFDVIELADYAKHLTGIHFSVDIQELVEA